MVLPGGGLIGWGWGECVVVILTGSSVISGFGERGTINALGWTREESRTGVRAATTTST